MRGDANSKAPVARNCLEISKITVAVPKIRFAAQPADYVAFGELCRDYVAWCGALYDDMPWFMETVFGHQSLDEELAALPAIYGAPNGRILLADMAGDIVGGGGWRARSSTVCELKRLYVSDRARGLGLGRRLSQALIASARAEGFATLQLDTTNRMTEAVAMYESMGFERVAPYRDYPKRLLPHLIFMEKAL